MIISSLSLKTAGCVWKTFGLAKGSQTTLTSGELGLKMSSQCYFCFAHILVIILFKLAYQKDSIVVVVIHNVLNRSVFFFSLCFFNFAMQHTGNYQQAEVAKFGYGEERKVELLLESCYILATFLNLFSKYDDFKILFFFSKIC